MLKVFDKRIEVNFDVGFSKQDKYLYFFWTLTQIFSLCFNWIYYVLIINVLCSLYRCFFDKNFDDRKRKQHICEVYFEVEKRHVKVA